VRFADRVSRAYAPLVHILALATALGWLVAGGGWHMALTTAVAVLIITCPCALGLAVPAVQVVASGFLLGRGVMLKDGSALERLAAVDTAIFDKTGTLTEGEPRLVGEPAASETEWAVAAALGQISRHPLARALARASARRGVRPATLEDVAEHPGDGVAGRLSSTPVRLGRRDFVGAAPRPDLMAGSEIWLKIGNAAPVRFAFEDALREDAAATVLALEDAGLDVKLLSGDRAAAVATVAARAGILNWRAEARPAEKATALSRLAAAGKHALMVGDGLNDAPALAAAFVSMSPSTAADISQTTADIVFTGKKLAPVALTLKVARATRRLMLQNVGLAVGYNLIAVPIAMLGYATPLIAAIAMSTSSIVVTANARDRAAGKADPPVPASAKPVDTKPAEAAS
jgi:Cu2+-exporting ATPase